MGKVLMIGAGGVATVAAFKIAKNADVFTEFMIASRRKEKCDQIVDAIHKAGINMDIKTAQVDADDVEQLKALFNDYKPELVINLALPYQDLTIMDACLACGCNYLDTANYEPKDEAHFEYSWQWAYKERFEQAGLTAILGCGFDPGVSGIYTAYAAKHHSTRFSISTSLTATPETTTRLSQQTSTLRLTSARLLRRDFTIRTASGLRQSRSRFTRRSLILTSVRARAI